MNGLTAIEALLQYAVNKGVMTVFDVATVRNQLFSLLRYPPEKINEQLFNVYDERSKAETATEILGAICDDYAARGHFKQDTVTERDNLNAAVMGLLMPRTSEIYSKFLRLYLESPVKATDDFYELCRAANYIQVDRIKNDLYWTAATEYGELEITVNLSKPEKDPRDIAAARQQPASGYPRCLLCPENAGFEGNTSWPARQNLRLIPLEIESEQWYFQYSPYSYYNEHCIVLNEKHIPMHMDIKTFRRLAMFVTNFPHYFLGSNADLPIVGGSILSHDHFQGGRHVFAMDKAAVYKRYKLDRFPDVEVSLVKWPLSVIRIASKNENQLVDLADYILNSWRGYTDESLDIRAFSGDTPHNTVTPIARSRSGKLEMDLVLRNNRTTEEHPLGLFHPHAQWHHIKKENIGLIEVMGLAVLPGRLRDELNESKITRDEINNVFVNVLKDCGVFKDTDEGKVGFHRFMEKLIFNR